METEQIAGPDGEKHSLKDFTDEELIQIYLKNYKSYADTAEFISTYFGVHSSRQAVFKRMQRHFVKQVKANEEIKEQAKKGIIGGYYTNNGCEAENQCSQNYS